MTGRKTRSRAAAAGPAARPGAFRRPMMSDFAKIPGLNRLRERTRAYASQ